MVPAPRARRLVPLVFPALVASAPWPAAPAADARDAFRQTVEADWARQDACRMALIRTPGLVRFAEGELAWPGLDPGSRLAIHPGPPPVFDGRLDDPCWRDAARLPAAAPGLPALLLARCDDRILVGLSFARALEPGFLGDPRALDAAGAVDGTKDGKYGFHAGHEPNPWWQVDLGSAVDIGRIVVWNRLDYAPGLHNADSLQILGSPEGTAWTPIHDQGGKHFGGVSGGDPLVVEPSPAAPGATPRRDRFVRLRIPSAAPIFFHLDEVEIFARGDPATNIALGRPASQSSLSPWSRGGADGGRLFRIGRLSAHLTGDAGRPVALSPSAPAGETPACDSALVRESGTTTAEVAIPVSAFRGFPGEVAPCGGAAVPVAAGGPWELDGSPPPGLGFGANRIAFGIRAPGPLDPPVEVEIETVVFTPTRAERRVAFRTTLGEPKRIETDVVVRHEGPAAVAIIARQGSAEVRKAEAFYVHPVAEVIGRIDAIRLECGAPDPAGLSDLRARAAALADRELARGPDPEARRALCLEARWLARGLTLSDAVLGVREVVFVKRFTQQAYPDVCLNHMPWVSRPGGDICALSDPAAGDGPSVRSILGNALGPGHVHGMDLSWDGRRIVFGFARRETAEPAPGWLDRSTSYDLRRTEEPIHIFEIGVDGTGLRQITDSEWSDLDPTWLPNGDIAFVSERCGYSLQCNELDKDETSCNLYVTRPDGTGIRRLSVTKDGDYLPHALDDGSIAYTRWEYQERGWANIQSIWTVRPDGTGADAVFKQHMNDPWALEESRSIPGSPKMAAIATGHHTLPAGPLVVVDPRGGFNTPDGIAIVTPGIDPPEGGMSGRVVPQGGVPGRGGFCMTPFPLSETRFLVSRNYGAETEPNGYALYLLDVHGTMELLHRDPEISCFAPIPLRPRTTPPSLPDLTDPAQDHATCLVQDVHRGVDGVAPGAIRYIRVARRLPWPYTIDGGGERYEPDVKSVMINWTPVQVLGTVPVEADGSAYFKVPVDQAVYFQLLDENLMELRRMRSFISFQPGEARGCIGCHETRPVAPPVAAFPRALLRDPSEPAPPPWGRRPLSFLRDVQPVFDRHCVSCHAGLEPAGGLDFSGGLTARHNRAYDTILERKLVSRSNVGDDARITQPLEFGSHRSRLVEAIRSESHARLRLDREDFERIVTWIDGNAPYHDAFIRKRAQPQPYDLAADARLHGEILAVHARRCGECHDASSVTRLDWIDLWRPQASRFLAAPLAAEAGGRGACGRPVYRDASDPDLARLSELVARAAGEALARPRRDLQAVLDAGETVGMAAPEPR